MALPGEEEREKRVREQLEYDFKPILPFLADKNVIEILLNPDGTIWADYLGEGKRRVGTMNSTSAAAAIGRVGAAFNTEVTTKSPIVECEFPLDGSRFEAVVPPLVSAPVFSIRKKAIKIFTLADYVQQKIINEKQAEIIRAAVKNHENILVVGGTSSGKTTLTNAILQEMVDQFPYERFVILEDTSELQCAAENTVPLHSVDGVDMTRLLKVTMRLAPDRIVVGEVRDGAALALLKAWNTGHPGGIATVHANNAAAGLTRIQQLVSEANTAPMQPLIAEAINVVLFLKKTKTGRRLQEIRRVTGYDQPAGKYLTTGEDE